MIISKKNIFKILHQLYFQYLKLQFMPPKKSQVTKQEEKQVQTKLFSKEKVEEPKNEISKGRSKQFDAKNSEIIEKGTSSGKWSYGQGKTPDKLFISSWNVNGIRAVMTKQELPKYINSSKPDIICINQTKIDEAAYQKAKIQLPGYHSYWNFCKCSAGYSGVAVFSKYLPISSTEDLLQKEHSQQGRVLTVQFEKFYLVTAYIPNAGQKLQRLDYRVDQYDKSFQAHCEKLRAKKTTIICGDLNVCHQQIDIAKPKGNQKTAGFTIQERKSFTSFLEAGWVDSFRTLHPKEVKYSWWNMRTGGRAKNIGWRLDYFVINKQSWKYVKQSKINNDIFGSDHCPIELIIDFQQ